MYWKRYYCCLCAGIKHCLFADDFEEDYLQEAAQDEELLRLQSLPRSVWEATLIKKHVDILELRERTRALTEARSYARLTDAAATENKNHLSHQVVLQLAMEYLTSLGFHRTVRMIQEESKVVCILNVLLLPVPLLYCRFFDMLRSSHKWRVTSTY